MRHSKGVAPAVGDQPFDKTQGDVAKDALVSERREFQDPALELRLRRSVAVNCRKRLPLLSKANPRGRARPDAKVLCIPSGVYSEIEPLNSLQLNPQMAPLTET